MPTPLLSLGMPATIAQNVVHALPARACFIMSSVAIEWSNDGTTWAALTGANTTGVTTGATFIRCPTASAVVTCKSL